MTLFNSRIPVPSLETIHIREGGDSFCSYMHFPAHVGNGCRIVLYSDKTSTFALHVRDWNFNSSK